MKLESIVVHINTFMGFVNQLAVPKFPLDNALQALLLLCTLPNYWENMVSRRKLVFTSGKEKCHFVPRAKKKTFVYKW